VCCSVVQFVAVGCSGLQWVAVCCSISHCVAVHCSVLQRVAVCCSVLQCVAVCCTVLQMKHALLDSWYARDSFSSRHLVSSVSVLHRNLLQYVPAYCGALYCVVRDTRCLVKWLIRDIFFPPPYLHKSRPISGVELHEWFLRVTWLLFWGGGFPQGSHMTPNLEESSGMAYSLRVKDLLSSVMCMCVYVYTKHLHTWHKSRPSLCGCARKEKKNFTRKNRSCHSTSLNLAVTCVPTTHPAWLGHKSRPSLVEQSGGNDSYVRLFSPQTHTHILTILDFDTSQGQVWWSQVAWMILTWDNFFFQIHPHILTLLDLTHTGLNVLAKNRRNWQVNFMIQASKSQKRDFRHFCRAKVCYSNGNVRFENFMHMEWSEEKFWKGIVGDTRRLRFWIKHQKIEFLLTQLARYNRMHERVLKYPKKIPGKLANK